ncbi:MAG: recombinase family protein [Singulisphaera sp.]|nr:recombinase family protein [Singulisphaera sp.]
MGVPAFGYTRVSSEGQAAEGVSLDAQAARIAAWCAANDADLIDTFVDSGISGGRADNRPGLRRALDAACRARGNVLVVSSLSRMARSTKDTISISERMHKSGANLVSLSEKIDTTSAAGKMVFRLLAVLAEFERDLASERTRLAAAYKRSRGEAWATPPFGQAKDAAGRLVDDPAERRVVDEVIKLRSDGMSIRAIVAIMNARGVPTRHGGRWHIATVQRVLRRARAGA